MQPHTHLRGKDMKVDAHYPTRGKETLLSVPRYDFNWPVVVGPSPLVRGGAQ